MGNPVTQFGNETVDSLAERIKTKYPDYAEVDNRELVGRIIRKYPEYQNRLSGGELEKLAGKPESVQGGVLERGLKGLGKGALTVLGAPGAILEQAGKPPDFTTLGNLAAKTVLAPSLPEKAGYAAAAALPLVGPYAAEKGEQAGRGDIAGVVGEAAGLALGGKALGKAANIASRIPRKAAIDPDIAYEQMGLAAQQYVAKPVKALRAEVAKHAQPLQEAIDTQFPEGSIQKSATLDVLNEGIKKYFPTNTRAGFEFPPSLRNIVKELASRHTDTITWGEAKSLRSALGSVLDKVHDRTSKAPLALAYKNLSEQMRIAAKDVGMEDSFNQYNAVHRSERALGELALDDVVDAQSGTDALKALDRQRGALKLRLDDLKPYGVDPKEITSLIDAYRPGQNAKLQRSIIDHWAARHAAGAIGSMLGAGFMPGYGGVLALQIAREGGRKALPEGAVNAGAAQARLNRVPPPMEVSEPKTTPVVEMPPAEKTFGERLESLPPIRVRPQAVAPETAARPSPASPSLPQSRYAESQQRLAEAGRLSKAVGVLRSGGKRALTEAEWKFIEKRTGLDMSDPKNLPAALTKLKSLLQAEQGKP